MPKHGQGVDVAEIQNRITTITKFSNKCFFMDKDFKFNVNNTMCYLVLIDKFMWVKEDKYVDSNLTYIVRAI